MLIEEIATKRNIKELEERLTELLLRQFQLMIQEFRMHNLKKAIEPPFTKKQVMVHLNVKSANTIDKWERNGKLIVEDWGDGKKRIPRYPRNQFDKWKDKAA